MAQQPLLIGDQLIFTLDGSLTELIILGHEIQSYKKIPFPPAIPNFQVGPLGQISQRQINLSTVPYRFQWVFNLTDLKKEQLEGFVAAQSHRYTKNNNRVDVEVTLSDERLATLELLAFSRPVRIPSLLIDLNPTDFTRWQFSEFIIKFESFVPQRIDKDFWQVNCNAVESRLNLEV